MTKQQPLKIKLGRITATIWENKNDRGTYYNVKFARIYKEENGWQSSDSFGRDDLLALAKVADLAHSKIYELRSTNNRQEAAAA